MNIYLLRNRTFRCGDPDCWIVITTDEYHARRLAALDLHSDPAPTLADAENWRERLLEDHAKDRERFQRWEHEGRRMTDLERRMVAAWDRGVLLYEADTDKERCTVEDLLALRREQWEEERASAEAWTSPRRSICTLLGTAAPGLAEGVIHSATFPG